MKALALKWGLTGAYFPGPEVERQYRDWRILERLPLMRIAAVASLASWCGVPLALYFWDSGKFSLVFPYLAGLILPVFTIGTALCFLPSARVTALPTVVALQIFGGSAATWLVYAVGGTPGSAVAWGFLVALFAPFMQLPPLSAALAVTPYTVLIVAFAGSTYRAGQLTSLDAFSYLCAPLFVLLVVVVVCAVNDHVSRRAFVNVMTIREQHRMLERTRMLIRRYIPRSVAERIEAGDELAVDVPARRRVTVLFSDIVGFTELADRMDPESLTQVVGEYMAAMSEIVTTNLGTVNEFIGDGLMAIFGAPTPLEPEDQAHRAVLAALAMQAALPRLNAQWRKLGLGPDLKVRIGINTGVVNVGTFGGEGRMTYTAIGLQTNIAARIQAHCNPGEVLLSETTRHLVSDRIECIARGEVQCKGVHYPVPTFSPTGVAVAG